MEGTFYTDHIPDIQLLKHAFSFLIQIDIKDRMQVQYPRHCHENILLIFLLRLRMEGTDKV